VSGQEMWPAADLVGQRRCTPQCLLALEPQCTCCCGGRWHGVLADALVNVGEHRAWYERYCGWSRLILDGLCPVIPAGIAAENREYRAAKRERRPFVVAQRRGQRFGMLADLETEGYGSKLDDQAVDLIDEILIRLLRLRRLRTATGGHSLIQATGVRTRVEAQVLGTLVRELNVGNPDGAQSCLAALVEDDPRRVEVVTA
jgi:hypothetical protein